MKKFLQKVQAILSLICILGISCIGTGCSRQPEVYNSVDTAMGTIINQTIYASPKEAALQREVTGEILSRIHLLEKDYLSWRLDTAEIYQINRSAGTGQAKVLSDKLAGILEQCKAVSAASDGAFDFTIGQLARLWDIDTWATMQATDSGQNKRFVVPTQEQIHLAMSNSQIDALGVEGNQILLPAGMQLDLGAVGKGIVLDDAKEILAAHTEVTGAVISAGGSILTYGSKPDGSCWNVAIVDPFDSAGSLGILKLTGQCCVSTSGDYERFVEVDGKRYHHILDPATGYPADSGVRSVTILSDSGILSDALSTACFVLGVEEGLELAQCFQAEALFVDEEGGIYMTEGMHNCFVAN